MYLYTPDEIDRERANHQAVIQDADDIDVKRIGNLGELAFEQFCRRRTLGVAGGGGDTAPNGSLMSPSDCRGTKPSRLS
ncbi:MAG: hypothetical protein U5K37_10010 [Natrialbaceae archaeon]|nr:hypothetical protein [Natrialbaceae archaeon]